VSTLTPLSVSLLPTPAPIMPGAITATTGVMLFSWNFVLFWGESCGQATTMARLLASDAALQALERSNQLPKQRVELVLLGRGERR
jgi:hypothetical protein